MLNVERLAIGYGGKAIVRDVSFTLAPGQSLCVLGANGSGKTTLFRTLLGLMPSLGGSISINGAELSALSRTDIARAIGYVPQAHATFFPFSVREIVLMGRAARIGVFDAPSAKDRDAAHAALDTLGLTSLADRAYTDISGGERQLALIARALAQDPQVLILDEPTANLDLGNQVRVLEQLLKLARSGRALMFASHDPDHAFACADRALVLHQGAVAALGAPQETLTPALLQSVYGVAVEIAYVPALERHVSAPRLPRQESGEQM